MTTIEHVCGRLRDFMTVDYPKVSSRPYKAAADPFTFDLQPRSDFDSWYIDPPSTRSEGWIGDVESVTAAINIWVSREAGEDAGGAAVALAGDLARLRHLVTAADFDAGPVDVNVHESVETHVQPRAEGAVVVVGRLALALDLRHGRRESVIPLGPGTSEKRRGAVAGPRWPWLLAVLDVRCAWCDRELRACYCVDNPRLPRAGPEPDIAAYIASLPKWCRGCYGLVPCKCAEFRARDARYCRTYRNKRRARGVCTRCPRPTEHYLCDDCHAATKHYGAAWRDRCKAEGRCERCPGRAEPGKTQCRRCLDVRAAQARAARGRAKAA